MAKLHMELCDNCGFIYSATTQTEFVTCETGDHYFRSIIICPKCGLKVDVNNPPKATDFWDEDDY